MTSENCLQQAIQDAEAELDALPEDVKASIINYSETIHR